MKSKIYAFFTVIAILFNITPLVFSQNAYDGYVYFTAEKLTLNQGFALEPIKVGFYKTDSLADISERALGEMSVFNGNTSNYYIQTIIDGGEPQNWNISDIPNDILSALGGEEEIYTRAKADRLSEYDYSVYSGWMFCIDNTGAAAGAADIHYDNAITANGTSFSDSSVIQLKYSLYGYGEDLGIGGGYYDFNTQNTFADKCTLIKKVADISYSQSQEEYGSHYNNAMNVLSDWDATDQEISNALNMLEDKEHSGSKIEWNGAMNMNIHNNQITDTPITLNNPEQKWSYSLNRNSGSWGYYYAGQSVIINDFLYATGGGLLHKINTKTGLAEKTVPAGSSSFYYDYLCAGENTIFVATASSIEVFDADTLQKLDSIEGNFGNYHPIQYNDGILVCNGYIYNVGQDSILSQVGSGPIEGALFGWSSGVFIDGNFYITGSSDAMNVDTLYCIDLSTNTLKHYFSFPDAYELPGSITGQTVYDKNSGYIYWSSAKDTMLRAIKLNPDGSFDNQSYKVSDIGQMSVCVPIIYNNRIYVAGQNGKITVINGDPQSELFMNIIYETSNSIGKIQSNPILSTAYQNETGNIYVYVQSYTKPGNIYYLQDSPNSYSGELTKLTDIKSSSNSAYAFEQIAIDDEGNIYFYNEEGYLYCWGEHSPYITVSAYDYTARDNNLPDASQSGIIIDNYRVYIDETDTAEDAVKRAFSENNIPADISGGYVSSINGLGAGEGFSGWCLAYNNDYSNGGLSSLCLKDGDSIRFDYSCNFDCNTDDIGNGWYGLPIIEDFEADGIQIKLGKTSVYDEFWNMSTEYFEEYENNTTIALDGNGTKDNPFIIYIPIKYNSDISNISTSITTSLNKHYCITEGINNTNDYTNGLEFSISDLGGFFKTYYKAVPVMLNSANTAVLKKSNDTYIFYAYGYQAEPLTAYLPAYSSDGSLSGVITSPIKNGAAALKSLNQKGERTEYFIWTYDMKPVLYNTK